MHMVPDLAAGHYTLAPLILYPGSVPHEPDYPTKLGRLIAASGMTIIEVAEALGINDHLWVRDHVHGRRGMRPKTVAMYCRLFNVDPEEIVE
jgi:hypothetical protein